MPSDHYGDIVKRLLEPTKGGVDFVLREMDHDNDGIISKSEAQQWWVKNCSSDLRAFEQAWTDADVDGSDDLRDDELKEFLGFAHDKSIRSRLRKQVSAENDFMTVDRNEYVTPQGKIMNLVGLGDGDSSLLVNSLDDGQLEGPSEASTDAVFADDPLNHFFYTLHVNITEGINLSAMDRGNTSDPYVRLKMLYSKDAEAELEAEAAAEEEAIREAEEEEAERNDMLALEPDPEPATEQETWTACTQHATGRECYISSLTQQSVWQLPVGAKMSAPAATEPVAQPDPNAELTGPAKCQFKGKGDFVDVWLSLMKDEHGMRQLNVHEGSTPAGRLLRIADVNGCSIKQPKDSRGFKHIRRIDLATEDSVGDTKYVLAIKAKDGGKRLDAWISALSHSTKHYNILSASIIGTETRVSVDQKDFTIYRVKVVPVQGKGTQLAADKEKIAQPRVVCKRFSDFVDLRETLMRVDDKGLVARQDFPSRDVLGGFGRGLLNQLSPEDSERKTQELVAQRRSTLDRWLALVMRHPRFASPMQTFLADEDMDELRLLQGLDRLAKSSSDAENYADAAEAYSQALKKQLLDPEGRANRFCGRARCYRELAKAANSSPSAAVQLWNKVLEDAVAATQSLPQEQTMEADSLRMEAQRELTVLSQIIVKETQTNHGSCEGQVHCQFEGKGNFERVWLSLTPAHTFKTLPPESSATFLARPTTYLLRIVTGSMIGAGTDARVFVTLFTQHKSSEEFELPIKRRHLERGQTDTFMMPMDKELGELQKLNVRHDGSGIGAGWYLDRIEVRSVQSNAQWNFRCNSWLAKDEGDGKIERDLTATSSGSGWLTFSKLPEHAATDGTLDLQRTAELHADIRISDPKTARKGYETAIRLDLGALPDDKGCKKHIIAVDTDEDLDRWKKALGAYCITLDKVMTQSALKQLKKEVKSLKSYSTEVKRKTISPYWDESFTYEWSCTRKQLRLLRLKVDCMDWNLIGSDSLIGSVDEIELQQVLDQVGTEKCFSQPFNYRLSAGKKDEPSSSELTMRIVLEEHQHPKLPRTLYPNYMLDYENFFKLHVHPPHSDSTSKRFILDVCLLGIRGLSDSLRHGSIEIIVNDDRKPSVVDDSLRGGMSKGAPARKPHQSKRLFIGGDGCDPSLADFKTLEQILCSLNHGDLRRYARLVGVAKEQPTVEDVLDAYQNVSFWQNQEDVRKGPKWHPKSLTVRVWHKPNMRASRFALHQPAECFAEACIPLIRRDPNAVVDDEVQEKARKVMQCYKEGMALLQVAAFEVAGGNTSTLMHPREKLMQEICDEIDFNDSDSRQGLDTAGSAAEKNEHLDNAIRQFKDGMRVAMEIPDTRGSQRQKLLTKLQSGQREVNLQQQYGEFGERWSQGREQLEGTWEASGSAVSHASLFPAWDLFVGEKGQKQKKVGTLRCAFKIRAADEHSNGGPSSEWRRLKSLSTPHPVIVRVYVIRGRALRAMDRNNLSDPYVTCALESTKSSGKTQQILGDRSLHKKATLNPEVRSHAVLIDICCVCHLFGYK